MPRLAAFCLAFALALAGSPSAHATWSIVLVDTSTQEVGAGSATCIANSNLKRSTGLLLVGIGAAQAQAFVNPSGANRKIIWNQLMAGATPQQALQIIINNDTDLQMRQFGIVDLKGNAVTFSGTQNTAWAGGVIGSVGTIHYAIQGNILVDAPVVLDAEQALRNTSGDLSQRLMAAMEAARAAGGDSRCTPQGKSSHVAYMAIARIGDTDGSCDNQRGCANGSYYMDLNVIAGAGARDPVLRLQNRYNQFRRDHQGQVDQIKTRAVIEPRTVFGAGQTDAFLYLGLKDVDGLLLPGGGATVTVSHDAASAGLSTIGPVQDRGNGRYAIPLGDIVGAGQDVFRVTVDSGMGPVTLFPFPTLTAQGSLRRLAPAGNQPARSVVQGSPPAVTLELDGGSTLAGRPFALLASASGTQPGTPLGGLQIPLNWDAVTQLTLAGSSTLSPWSRNLDRRGQASVTLQPTPGAQLLLAGQSMDLAWIALQPVDYVSNPVRIQW